MTLGTSAGAALIGGGFIGGVVSLVVSKREYKHNTDRLTFEIDKSRREENAEFRNSERAKRIADYYAILDLVDDLLEAVTAHHSGSASLHNKERFNENQQKLLAANRLAKRMRLHHSPGLAENCAETLRFYSLLESAALKSDPALKFTLLAYDEVLKNFTWWHKRMVEKLRGAIQDEEDK